MNDSNKQQFEQQAVLKLLDEFEAPPVSPDFNRRLWQAIEAAPQPSFFDFAKMWLKPAIPVAVITALVVAGFALDHRPLVPGVTTPGVTALDADRVERTLDDIQLLGQVEKTQDGVPAV